MTWQEQEEWLNKHGTLSVAWREGSYNIYWYSEFAAIRREANHAMKSEAVSTIFEKVREDVYSTCGHLERLNTG